MVDRDFLLRPHSGPPMHSIIAEVAAKHGVTYMDMVSARRGKDIVLARHEAYYRCRNETSHTYPEIGRAFGGRDHTTIMAGEKRHVERNPHLQGRKAPLQTQSPQDSEQREKQL